MASLRGRAGAPGDAHAVRRVRAGAKPDTAARWPLLDLKSHPCLCAYWHQISCRLSCLFAGCRVAVRSIEERQGAREKLAANREKEQSRNATDALSQDLPPALTRLRSCYYHATALLSHRGGPPAPTRLRPCYYHATALLSHRGLPAVLLPSLPPSWASLYACCSNRMRRLTHLPVRASRASKQIEKQAVRAIRVAVYTAALFGFQPIL